MEGLSARHPFLPFPWHAWPRQGVGHLFGKGRRALLGALAPLLLACALQTDLPLRVYPGGYAEGPYVEGRFQAVLPGPPLLLDADEAALYAAYPFQLLRINGGLESLPLPSTPLFLRARPRLVVGLAEGVYTEEGLFPYRAKDALLLDGLYYVNETGLYREGVRLEAGDFWQVVALKGKVYALGGRLYRHPDGHTAPLPPGLKKAEAGLEALFLLAEDGLYRLDEEGRVLAHRPGRFRDLAVGDLVYAVEGNGLRRFSLLLEER